MLYMYYIYYYNTNALYPTNYNCMFFNIITPSEQANA